LFFNVLHALIKGWCFIGTASDSIPVQSFNLAILIAGPLSRQLLNMVLAGKNTADSAVQNTNGFSSRGFEHWHESASPFDIGNSAYSGSDLNSEEIDMASQSAGGMNKDISKQRSRLKKLSFHIPYSQKLHFISQI
jgi:hypothetical protein